MSPKYISFSGFTSRTIEKPQLPSLLLPWPPRAGVQSSQPGNNGTKCLSFVYSSRIHQCNAQHPIREFALAPLLICPAVSVRRCCSLCCRGNEMVAVLCVFSLTFQGGKICQDFPDVKSSRGDFHPGFVWDKDQERTAQAGNGWWRQEGHNIGESWCLLSGTRWFHVATPFAILSPQPIFPLAIFTTVVNHITFTRKTTSKCLLVGNIRFVCEFVATPLQMGVLCRYSKVALLSVNRHVS